MSVHAVASPRRDTRPSLLDVAAEVLVADPAAALAEVAEAAAPTADCGRLPRP